MVAPTFIMYTLKILGYSYKVDFSKTQQELGGNLGFCNFDKKLLQVARDADKEVQHSTLIHEILEAINFHLEIGLEEPQIKQLEVGLHQTLIGLIKE
jgi:hypothetical protein